MTVLDSRMSVDLTRNDSFESLGCDDKVGKTSLAENGHSKSVFSPTKRSSFNTSSALEQHPMFIEAWESLRKSTVYFCGQPVAALDNSDKKLNYDQVKNVRDFVPWALALLMKGKSENVKNFILKTLWLQSWKKTVDSGFWWIILLRAYTISTGDTSLVQMPECQKGIRSILSLCLSQRFDIFPTLLCADGCSMIDSSMGVHGYPIEIQALFYMALRCATYLLKQDAQGKVLMDRIVKRLHALSFHVRSYYWLDLSKLNDIYRYKTEEYSDSAVNKFNVFPDSLPEWVFDFMPTHGGYFLGNVSTSNMDFRWFCLGNCIAILSSLATPEQSAAIMDLIECRWQELVGEMPVKICYPSIENDDWRIITGSDPKNTSWSYHNGGSWPVLLWSLTAACIKAGRPQIARRAIELAELRLAKDDWPEYYDGKSGRYIGKKARKHQTWSIAGYLVSKMMLEDPSHAHMISFDYEDNKKIAI
ncbi:hypothetical protein QVD17_19867 [Tagetes erecta]|uniref:Alkaline/neutral invertase n=1 Tax=Tagetes erecta TaxID=13708 RepID=A0AAD8KKE0_TARER|nr:hypothetical protein QVD17_19867 [Tagetes erecta]